MSTFEDINWDEIPDSILIPNGLYPAVIKNCEVRKTKEAQANMLVISLEFNEVSNVDGSELESVVLTYTTMLELVGNMKKDLLLVQIKALFNALQDRELFSVINDEEELAAWCADQIGKEVNAKVIVQNRNGEDLNSVSKLLPVTN